MEQSSAAPSSSFNFQSWLVSCVDTAKRVITAPSEFFKQMQKSGGYKEPVMFIAAVAICVTLIETVFSLFGFSYRGSFAAALLMVVIFPLVSFLSAAIMYGIWKLMGSKESYETAYRCCAYSSAIYPIMTIISLLPYINHIISAVWTVTLAVIISVTVHAIPMKKALIVFGCLCAVMAVFGIRAEKAARSMQKTVRSLSRMENMTPEEAGKTFGEFMKGFQQGAGK